MSLFLCVKSICDEYCYFFLLLVIKKLSKNHFNRTSILLLEKISLEPVSKAKGRRFTMHK